MADYTPTSGTWITWCSDTSSVTNYNITTDNSWQVWTDGTIGSNNVQYAPNHEFKTRSVASRQEQAAYEQRMAAQRAEREKKRKKADATAKKLLESLLTDSQRKSLEEMSAFVVKSELGKMYKIRRGSHGNVKELNDDGQEIASLCIQPRGVPVHDMMAAQLLMLQTDEKRFLKIANRTTIRNMARV